MLTTRAFLKSLVGIAAAPFVAKPHPFVIPQRTEYLPPADGKTFGYLENDSVIMRYGSRQTRTINVRAIMVDLKPTYRPSFRFGGKDMQGGLWRRKFLVACVADGEDGSAWRHVDGEKWELIDNPKETA